MTAAEQRWWTENTWGGMVARAVGANPFAVDHDRADDEVEAVAKFYERTYGRKLSEADTASVRFAAEQRSVPAASRVIRTTAEFVEAVNSANVSAGLGYQPVFRRGEGVATFQNGRWAGDPAVVGAVQGAEAERARQAAEAGDEWVNGPLIMRTVGRPT